MAYYKAKFKINNHKISFFKDILNRKCIRQCLPIIFYELQVILIMLDFNLEVAVDQHRLTFITDPADQI
jgi:hypothetical protein